MPDDPLDLGIFSLPIEERSDSPELARLQNRRTSTRDRVKARFWRRLESKPIACEPLQPRARALVSEAKELGLGPKPVAPRRFNVPSDIAEAIEEQTPQFCLRNLHRYEKDAWVDDLWWTREPLRPIPAEIYEGLQSIHADTRPGVQVREPLASTALQHHRQAHRQLIDEEPWEGFSWRRGPTVVGDDPNHHR